jgi:hypothetical protein
MAETVGLVASIVTILQVTNSVLSVCYDYGAAARGASWELPRIRTEIEGLRNILQTHEPLARKAEFADPAAGTRLPTLALLCRSNGVLQNCLDEMTRLDARLKPPGWSDDFGPKRKALIQALSWPFKEAETKKILERIAGFRETLALAFNEDQT